MYSVLGYFSIVFLLIFIRLKEPNKLLALIVGMICLTAFPCPVPLVNGVSAALPCFYILSRVRHFDSDIRKIRCSILRPLLIILGISILVLFFHSPHFNNLLSYKAFYFFRDLLFTTYFYLCFGFLGNYNVVAYKRISYTTYVCTLVLTLFGLLNFIGGKSYLIDFIYGGTSLASDTLNRAMSTFDDSSRFRVTAMFLNSFDYGYMCCCILLFQLCMSVKKIISRFRLLMTVICCAFGAFSCGSRSVLLAMILSVLVFVLFAYSLRGKIKIFIFSAILLLLISLTTGIIGAIYDKLASMFLSSGDVEGSSLEGRLVQISAVLYHIKENLMFGNGYGYFLIDMGWAGGKQALVDKDLYGIEGVYMSVLLERGIVGLIFYYAFWLTLLFYLVIKRKADISSSACAISLVVCYMVFAHSTGELNSLPATLFFIGICISSMKRKNNIYDKV